MNLEEKIARGAELKDEGNALFKARDRKAALRKYHESLLYLHGQSTQDVTVPLRQKDAVVSDDQKQQIDALLVSIYANMAACHIGDQKWEQVIRYSGKALDKDPDHFKARLRRANAYLSTGNTDRAERDLEALATSHPDGKCHKRCQLMRSPSC
ncbi:hypothetical protein THASP1DRAFT_21218 [Thamnocephalis sphaerospora]|uniref:Uncharacterized protein n=1 Tax=Thamnocephalis sphaerospora TaxID=78915 RepID=A0A4P9XXW9_9FUNG|nr:hypothetical protein THASP1DRAFT_21218 [Thamnocephalis sphaerospora]|eukprot:RKP11197.1 hypothetical protein THASP1DRAFT_21218 [Thamnocephalis sphaerospora]